eukprot:TRINITY_DN503_c0_g1_i1.p1 TRINITY_DN503_c0_g1~~TRINITY_DN503_c0_g1_i1.p1  ORF type:complete len:767 (-),score=203.18 TRINITY_DN503_c0_g1_i1:158-2458(-)
MKYFSLFLVVSLFLLKESWGISGQEERTVFSQRMGEEHPKWRLLKEDSVELNSKIGFSILLKKRNLEKLNQIFEQVSDPTHKNYQKYMTMEQVNKLTRPSQASFDQVYHWLRENHENGDDFTVEEGNALIKVNTNVKRASNLFNTRFVKYQHKESGLLLTRHIGDASHPTHLEDHIDIIAGISELFESTPHYKKVDIDSINKKKRADDPFAYDSSFIITPSSLSGYYNGSASLSAQQSSNHQGIFAFLDYYSAAALQSFANANSIPIPSVNNFGTNCIPNGCDQVESNLDIQYIISTGRNVTTDFISSPNGYWILEALEDTLPNLPVLPHVISVSYGSPEFLQCGNYEKCQMGYTTSKYISRSDSDFQSYAVQGVSFLISSGDNGAVGGFPQTGNCPLTTATYCHNSNCQYKTSQCQQVLLTYGASPVLGGGTTIVFPVSYQSSEQISQDSFNGWSAANSGCNLAYDNGFLHSDCACSSLKYGTYSGQTFALYSGYSTSNGQAFTPEWPASSPYVTSVGATIIKSNGGVVTEEAASIDNGAVITSGGGFSQYASRQSYQSTAVSSWSSSSSTKPPSTTYSANNRGYPDVSFAGHAYVIYSGTTNPSGIYVDGTSASAPALAGYIALLNDRLISLGKKPLGFLNPLLYQAYQSDPSIFIDIVTGSNKCSASSCCSLGFEATAGWDPVTGLGSPNIGKLYSYVLGSNLESWNPAASKIVTVASVNPIGVKSKSNSPSTTTTQARFSESSKTNINLVSIIFVVVVLLQI